MTSEVDCVIRTALVMTRMTNFKGEVGQSQKSKVKWNGIQGGGTLGFISRGSNESRYTVHRKQVKSRNMK